MLWKPAAALPVAISPETCVSAFCSAPFGRLASAKNGPGRVPVALKAFWIAFATDCWF